MSIQYSPWTGIQNSGETFAPTATLSRLKLFLRRHIDAWRKYQELRNAWRVNRLAFQHVLYLDDRMLEDMGVTREDVLWANKLPLRQNAALELRKLSRTRCHPVHRRPAKKYW